MHLTIKKILTALFMLPLTFVLTACAPKTESGQADSGAYHKIDAETAKQMMDEQEVTVVDVRTQEEYASGHLPGAILLPLDTIGDEAPASLPDKDSSLIVYCRSGKRSKTASDKLVQIGYTDVNDMGGILDWPYDTVTE